MAGSFYGGTNTEPLNGNTAAPSSFYQDSGGNYSEANPDEALEYVSEAQAAAAAAAASQAAAATSAAGAASSATTATNEATIATTQASSAATNAGVAYTNAQSAQTSATNAAASATAAASSATTATNEANTATTEAGAASTSATNAASSATAAASSASAASTSATNAANSASAAATSAANAASAVQAAAGTASPAMDSTAAVGTSTKWAHEDHVHPTDTSRAPLASPGLTGIPTAPTAANGTNTTQLATTAFVIANAGSTPGALINTNNLSDVSSAAASMRNLGGMDLSTTVSIITTTTLTTSAFGKLHLISGTSAFTVTLPTPVGNAGAIIGLSVDGAANATKMYTIASPSGNIGRNTSISMWALEQVVIRSDGTKWVIVSAKQIPLVGQLTTSTNQTSGAAPGVEVQFTSGVGDPTGLNLVYDSTNKRFLAPRASTYLLMPYVYQTATSPSYSQVAINNSGATQLAGPFSWTGTVAAGTLYGTARLTLASGGMARIMARTDGSSPLIAAATVPATLDYTEVVPSW